MRLKPQNIKPDGIWRDVQGFEGLYEVSESGFVWSKDRYVLHRRHGHQLIFGRVLRPGTDGWGYQFVYLRKEGKSHMRKLHRAVAIAHIPNPNNLPEINHEDGDKKNCHVSNLSWCTSRENIRHAYATGLISARRGKDNKNSKPVIQKDKDGNVIATFHAAIEAQRLTGIAHQSICCCARGVKHYNTAGGYKWEFAK